MFIVIYKFEVEKGLEKDFEEEWAELTHAFINYANGLGSRLHKDEQGNYVAYAQWPDQETWKEARIKLPEKAKKISKQMRARCSNVEILHTLNEVKDLLKTDK
jgi:quinol monooxygenase YgiN